MAQTTQIKRYLQFDPFAILAAMKEALELNCSLSTIHAIVSTQNLTGSVWK
jgi:hypothetical protein